MEKIRTSKDVIDQAIKENKVPECLLYIFAILFVLTGITILIIGIQKGETVTTVAGVISSSFFLPAMKNARQIRKENIAIRLLEAPLSRADSAKEASDMLRDIVKHIYFRKENKQ